MNGSTFKKYTGAREKSFPVSELAHPPSSTLENQIVPRVRSRIFRSCVLRKNRFRNLVAASPTRSYCPRSRGSSSTQLDHSTRRVMLALWQQAAVLQACALLLLPRTQLVVKARRYSSTMGRLLLTLEPAMASSARPSRTSLTA